MDGGFSGGGEVGVCVEFLFRLAREALGGGLVAGRLERSVRGSRWAVRSNGDSDGGADEGSELVRRTSEWEIGPADGGMWDRMGKCASVVQARK